MIKKLNFIQTPYEYDCGRLHLLIKANSETKTIHVVDCLSPTSLLNCREVMQPRILTQFQREENPSDWNWLWYGGNKKIFLLAAGNEGPGNLIDAKHKAVDSEMLSTVEKLSFIEAWAN